MAQVINENGVQTIEDSVELTRIKDIFVGLDEVKKFVQDGAVTIFNQIDFDLSISRQSKYMQEVYRHSLIKEMGRQKYALGRFRDAIGDYIRAATSLLKYKGDVSLPSFDDDDSGMYDKICGGPGYAELFHLLTLASCYNNIALCFMKLKNRVEAIDWLQEVSKLYILREELHRSDGFPWVSNYPANLEYFSYFIKSQMRLAEVFQGLVNTGSATYSRYLCANFGLNASIGCAELEQLRQQSKNVYVPAERHPSFKCCTEIVDPELQIRGAWTKLHARRGFRPRSRSEFSSWIWRGTLYVYGGLDYCRKTRLLRDLWCLDLKNMDAWRRLPEMPHLFGLEYIIDTKMHVWRDDAWLFVGGTVVFKFNMLLERWVHVETRWNSKEPWPYAKKMATEYCAEIFEGQLHIFGGADGLESTGINLHMRLDLSTLVWTKLGGTIDPRERIAGMPMFRKAAGSWVVPQEKRMYILYGYASITDAVAEGKTKRSEYQYEDMWSYSFRENKWRVERFRGNFPAPRVKMACTYHPGVQQVVLFGGGNLRMRTFDEEERTRVILPLAFFGDTFVLDMKTGIWRQVLTRNFPHHRLYSQMNVDAETGKMYLYGGSCSSLFMPSKNVDEESKTVSLGDLWQLDLDLPGQNFELRAFDTKSLIRGFGPWKLCFGCKEYKTEIKKCGGTCAGLIYLCSVECQKRSWNEHKRVHQCGRF